MVGQKQLKPKPKAKNVDRIRNSSAVTSNNTSLPALLVLSDNVQREVMVVGNGYFAPTVINVGVLFVVIQGEFDSHLEELEESDDNPKTKITMLSFLLILILASCLVASFRMERGMVK